MGSEDSMSRRGYKSDLMIHYVNCNSPDKRTVVPVNIFDLRLQLLNEVRDGQSQRSAP